MEDFLKVCQECAELELYCIINSLGGSIFGINHEWADGRIHEDPKKIQNTLDELQKKIEIAVDQVTRFGVEHPRIDGAATPEYWAWFRNWDQYVKGLSKEESAQLQDDLNQKNDLTNWHPAKTWQEVLEAKK